MFINILFKTFVERELVTAEIETCFTCMVCSIFGNSSER